MRMPENARQTIAAGAASLLIELVFLRYLPGHVRVLGYFTNFVLLAAFVGLGVGMIAARRWPAAERIAWSAPFGVAALVAFAYLARDLHVNGTRAEVLFLEYDTHAKSVPLYPFLAGAYVFITASFLPIGYWVGRTLSGPEPLARYSCNIAGSLLGIAAFAVVSAVGAPPWCWMIVALVPLALALASAPWSWRGIGLVVAVGTVIAARASASNATWSSYQKISTGPVVIDPVGRRVVQEWDLPGLDPAARARLVTLPESTGFTVRVNDDSYQTPLNLSTEAVTALPALGPLALQYELPYLARPPGRVLVLGAGTGNDVAAALRKGATEVDAVEIDAAILALGKKHPEHPYDDPRVHAHLADARTFLARTDQHWDTIVYGLLDSHVLLSSSLSSVRLDSYVFTAESFAVAKSRLADGGILVVSHAVGTPWFVARMRATLTQAFGRPPLLLSEQIRHPLGYIYVAGELVPSSAPPPPGTDVLTDDWPFVYLRAHEIPHEYLTAALLIAALSLAFVGAMSGRALRGFDLHFFFLGAAFLLLETRGLSALALLVGSTWAVTSAVFAAVLVMALVATFIATRLGGEKAPPKMVQAAYILLAGAIGLQAAIGMNVLSDFPLGARVVLGAILVCLPIVGSGVVFGISLARSGEADRALASNLIGALAGGLTEYLSMILGLHALIYLAAAFYALAYLTGGRYRAPVPES